MPSRDSAFLLGDINSHMGIDGETLSWIIKRDSVFVVADLGGGCSSSLIVFFELGQWVLFREL